MMNESQRRIFKEASNFGGASISKIEQIAKIINEAPPFDMSGSGTLFGYSKQQFEAKMRQLIQKMGFERGINKIDIANNKMMLHFANAAKARDFTIAFNGLTKRQSKGSPATINTSFDKVKAPAGTNAIVTVDFGMLKIEGFLDKASHLFIMLESLHEEYIKEDAVKTAMEDKIESEGVEVKEENLNIGTYGFRIDRDGGKFVLYQLSYSQGSVRFPDGRKGTVIGRYVTRDEAIAAAKRNAGVKEEVELDEQSYQTEKVNKELKPSSKKALDTIYNYIEILRTEWGDHRGDGAMKVIEKSAKSLQSDTAMASVGNNIVGFIKMLKSSDAKKYDYRNKAINGIFDIVSGLVGGKGDGFFRSMYSEAMTAERERELSKKIKEQDKKTTAAYYRSPPSHKGQLQAAADFEKEHKKSKALGALYRKEGESHKVYGESGKVLKTSSRTEPREVVVPREWTESVEEANDVGLQHSRNIARKTVKMNDVMVNVMGGMNKKQAWELLSKHGTPKEKAAANAWLKGQKESVDVSEEELTKVGYALVVDNKIVYRGNKKQCLKKAKEYGGLKFPKVFVTFTPKNIGQAWQKEEIEQIDEAGQAKLARLGKSYDRARIGARGVLNPENKKRLGDVYFKMRDKILDKRKERIERGTFDKEAELKAVVAKNIGTFSKMFGKKTEAYAPLDTKGIIGAFTEVTKKNRFEYRTSTDSWGKSHGLPHEVAVADFNHPWRVAHVKGTVCYIAVDEGADGKPVMEKWAIRNHVKYVKAEETEQEGEVIEEQDRVPVQGSKMVYVGQSLRALQDKSMFSGSVVKGERYKVATNAKGKVDLVHQATGYRTAVRNVDATTIEALIKDRVLT
jgi:hypothetical protein